MDLRCWNLFNLKQFNLTGHDNNIINSDAASKGCTMIKICGILRNVVNCVRRGFPNVENV
jgi:hypothetical protein